MKIKMNLSKEQPKTAQLSNGDLLVLDVSLTESEIRQMLISNTASAMRVRFLGKGVWHKRIWEWLGIGEPFDVRMMRYVAGVLKVNTVLKSLNLYNNQIADQGLKAIADALVVEYRTYIVEFIKYSNN